MAEPASTPRWATDGGALITTPSSGAQDIGHVPNTALTAQLANWFWNLVYQWVVFFQAQRDALIVGLGGVASDGSDEQLVNALRVREETNALCAGAVVEFDSSDQFAACAANATGRIVGVGVSGAIKYSDDGGLTWTGATPGSAFAGDFFCIAYASGLDLFIAGGDGSLQSSPDGITWTQRASGVQFTNVAWGNSTVVVTTWDGATTYTTRTSANGTAYTTHAQAIELTPNALAFGAGLFISAKHFASGTAYSSPDGVTWTARAWGSSSTMLPRAIGYCSGTGHFVAYGDISGTARELQVSTDGVTWIRARLSASGSAKALIVTPTAAYALATNAGAADWVCLAGASPNGLDFKAGSLATLDARPCAVALLGRSYVFLGAQDFGSGNVVRATFVL